MLITTWQKRNSLQPNSNLALVFNNDPLENISKEKLLGVNLNHNLSWEDHIYQLEKIINRKIALLRKIKCYLPIQTRKLFYNAHILSHMDYCSIVWGSSCFVDRLSLLQKKAARIILDITDNQFPSIQMLKELNWMTVQDRINFRKVSIYCEFICCMNYLDSCTSQSGWHLL